MNRLRPFYPEDLSYHLDARTERSAAFVPCPACLIVGLNPEQLQWQAHLYEMAMQKAQAEAQPSLLERALHVIFN